MQPNFQLLAKFIILIGFILVVVGAVLYFFKGIPFLGKLPGDIHIEKKNFSFHFPIMTCILLSVAISLLIYLISKK
jgi:polyferredoxin